jgi:ribonuclease HI
MPTEESSDLTQRKKVIIHTDGACEGNPGVGGWAAVLEYNNHTKQVSGAEPATTNNRMELQAVIQALQILSEPCLVTIFTDSKYLIEGATKWVISWEKRGWVTAKKEPVKNEDLWRQLIYYSSTHVVSWTWVKGHAGHLLNEQCDSLATQQISELKKKYSREQLKSILADFKSG